MLTSYDLVVLVIERMVARGDITLRQASEALRDAINLDVIDAPIMDDDHPNDVAGEH